MSGYRTGYQHFLTALAGDAEKEMGLRLDRIHAASGAHSFLRSRTWVVTHDSSISHYLYICMLSSRFRNQPLLTSYSPGIKGILNCLPWTMSRAIDSRISPVPAFF